MAKRSFARAPDRRRAGPDAPRAVVHEHRRRLTDSLTKAAQSFHSRNPDPVAMELTRFRGRICSKPIFQIVISAISLNYLRK